MMIGVCFLIQSEIYPRQGSGFRQPEAILEDQISQNTQLPALTVRNLQFDRWEEVVLFYFDTFLNIVNRGVTRIFCDLNGRKFILTTVAEELSRGDNIFLIPARDTVIINIAPYMNAAPENSLLRLIPQGPPGSDADIVVADASGKLREKVDFSLDLTQYPQFFLALQNFPNPFNSTTVVRFTVPEIYLFGVNVHLVIYNSLGQKVRALFSGKRFPGTSSILWDATDDRGEALASGIYFYQLIMAGQQKTSRMVLVK